MTDINYSHEVIEGYRLLIKERYDDTWLRANYTVPPTFTIDRIETLRNFFLNYIYPPAEQRDMLDEAFEHLDGHIRHPDHLLRILIDSGGLLLKFGRHLPSILRAGLKALRSFRTASEFESHLVEIAEQKKLKPPYSVKDMEGLIARLPREEIDHFIDKSLALFETLYDRQLVQRVIYIVDQLIDKMKKRPKIYAPQEIMALSLGREIIAKGDQLFGELSEGDQKKLFETVVQIERESIERIFSGK